MKVLTFWVEGRPVPKERAGRIRVGRGKYRSFNPPRTEAWEARVRLVAQAACSAARWESVAGEYAVDVVVYRERRAGDADNFLKAAKDAIQGVCFPNDRMVTEASVKLVDGHGTGMSVRVTRMTQEAA